MSSKRSAPAPQAAPQEEREKVPGYRWDGDNLVITGNVTGEEIAKAQADRKAEKDKAFKDSSPSRPEDKESAEDIAAREQSTLANPKKQKLRGRRTLVSSASLGSGVSSTRETLG
jgi:hypothetical protein